MLQFHTSVVFFRRTRDVFDVAVKVHKNIQQRDIDLGRNLGNWILRWLHRMKPSAEIRPQASDVSTNSNNFPKTVASSCQSHVAEDKLKSTKESNDRVQFTSLTSISKNFPTMPMMMQPISFPNWKSQHRQISNSVLYSLSFQRRGFAGVIRDDIAHWMRRWSVDSFGYYNFSSCGFKPRVFILYVRKVIELLIKLCWVSSSGGCFS